MMEKRLANLKKIVEYQEKLLVCYRIGGQPSGKLIDNLRAAKTREKEYEEHVYP